MVYQEIRNAVSVLAPSQRKALFAKYSLRVMKSVSVDLYCDGAANVTIGFIKGLRGRIVEIGPRGKICNVVIL